MKKSTILLLVVISFISCSKKEYLSSTTADNSEKLIFVKVKSEAVSNGSIIGSNISTHSQISYTNSMLDSLKSSELWTKSISKLNLETNNLYKTTFTNNTLMLITIPVKSNLIGSQRYLNVYTRNNKYVVTDFYIENLPNGNKRVSVSDFKTHDLYYQLEINQLNRFGNWKMGNVNMPLKSLYEQTSNTNKTFALSDAPDCASQTFNNCMNCLIVQNCGSNWMCMVACSVEIYACVAGAAALCIIG